MFNYIAILIMALQIGCGIPLDSSGETRPALLPTGQLEETRPILQLFTARTGIPVAWLPIGWAPFDMGKAIGQCHRSKGYRFILIDRAYWQTASKTERETLVLHELGHCVLQLGHTVELGIMYPYNIGGMAEYEAERDAFLADFFSE